MWHSEVITAPAEATAHALVRASVLTGFYLAGGTGLALQFGHRRSDDLDLFRASARKCRACRSGKALRRLYAT